MDAITLEFSLLETTMSDGSEGCSRSEMRINGVVSQQVGSVIRATLIVQRSRHLLGITNY